MKLNRGNRKNISLRNTASLTSEVGLAHNAANCAPAEKLWFAGIDKRVVIFSWIQRSKKKSNKEKNEDEKKENEESGIECSYVA